ncbi:hypothetical protein MKK65_26055 [Methylobacterium sp. J-001]|uniref:hypothetical protein n=1 Tax=Methylobacterium sp. J-001 TaxID=2836609 RepID=UPI001FBB75FE|nr:hypothetical protein [Methylobacterium sp. J-001]MCJ2119995.1 hypothetical protein [Methylobacterium sp. J-001]
MTKQQWDALSALVADRMKAATRNFVTPVIHEALNEPTHIGSATYVELPRQVGGTTLITCEHITRYQDQKHLPFGSNSPVNLSGTTCSDREPLDVGTIKLNDPTWQLQKEQAAMVGWSRFSQNHSPVPDELLFFYGLSGENTYSGYGDFHKIMVGYCSQEKRGTGDSEIFEIFWEPENTSITPGTSLEIYNKTKYSNAGGYSGSLVWDTRFVQKGCDINSWSPSDAVVTGLLRRWDTATRTLLVWRVEHLRKWLAGRPTWA